MIFENPSRKTFILSSIGIVLLAALGQLCMVQQNVPWTLWGGLFFYALAVFLMWRAFPPSSLKTFSLSTPVETALFVVILLLGYFLRANGIREFPTGIFADRAEVACQALRIAHDHWRPGLETLHFHIAEWCVYYLLAGWFWLFGNDTITFGYFDVTLSTLGLALTYAAFRQVLDARAALLGFFLLAVMRWNFVFAHQVYFQSQTILFLFLTLALLFLGLRKKNVFAAAGGGAALAAGLYAYQALKIAPLLIVFYMGFEFFLEREKFRENKKSWIFFWAIFFIFALPLALWMVQNGEIGRREMEVSIFSTSQGKAYQGFGKTLVQNIEYVLLLFNRLGTYNNQSDFQLHRMLDDGTGPLFVLSFFFALSRFRSKAFFYMIAGLAVMSLPGLLSIYGGNAGRLLGMTPFIAYSCGLFLVEVMDRWKGSGGSRSGVGVLLLVLFLSVVAAQNYYDFFIQERRDPACQNDYSWAESKVGSLVVKAPPQTEFFLPAYFMGHPTVGYLSYPNWGHFHLLDLSHLPQASAFTPGTSFLFFEDELKMASIDLIQKTYPGAQAASFPDPLGEVKVYSVFIDASHLAHPERDRSLRGLVGEYRHNETDKPFLTRLDPLINFSYSDLPQIGTPLFIHWSGKVQIAQAGSYDLWLLTLADGRGRMKVDGKDSGVFTPNPKGTYELGRGSHRFDLYLQQDPVAFGAANLLWKKSGEKDYQLVPNEAFGKIIASH